MFRNLKPVFSLVLCVFQGVSLLLNAQIIGPKDRFEQAKVSLMGYPGIKNASFSWCLRDAESNQILDSCHTGLRLIPASTAKLTTSMVGLALLGPVFSYQTPVYIRGELKRNQLQGDLILVGSGDPSFGSGIAGAESADSILSRIYATLKKHQIRKIKGRILIDPHALPFNHLSIPGSWQWDDIGNYYGAGIYGLNWRSNSFSIELVQEKGKNEPASISSVHPHLYEVELINSVRSNQSEPDQDLYIYSSPLSKTIVVDGNMHPGTLQLTAKGSIPNPPLQAGHEILQFLKSKGIEVTQGIAIPESRLSVDSTYIQVETFQSPPLEELMKEINKHSNNLFAEGLFQTIGNTIDAATMPSALGDTLEHFIEQHFNLAQPAVEIADGCGLSRRNLLTAGFQSELLASFTKHVHFNAFRNSLAEAGVSGTFKSFEEIPGLVGKTGSMGGVRAFAGYLNDRTGRRLAFSILVNNYEGTGVELKSRIMEWLAGASEHQF